MLTASPEGNEKKKTVRKREEWEMRDMLKREGSEGNICRQTGREIHRKTMTPMESCKQRER